MTATYTPPPATEMDWVRFMIGDTDMTRPLLQDEEIQAVIDEQEATGSARKYFAAADCLGALRARWSGSGQGVVSKTVSRLSKTWGMGSGTLEAIDSRIRELRQRGSFRLTPHDPGSRFFSVSRPGVKPRVT